MHSKNFATPGQPGIQWDLQPIRVTAISWFDSKVLSDHELLRLNVATNVLLRLVPQDTSVIVDTMSMS